MLQSVGLWRVRHDWVTELNWTDTAVLLASRQMKKIRNAKKLAKVTYTACERGRKEKKSWGISVTAHVVSGLLKCYLLRDLMKMHILLKQVRWEPEILHFSKTFKWYWCCWFRLIGYDASWDFWMSFSRSPNKTLAIILLWSVICWFDQWWNHTSLLSTLIQSSI